MKHINNFKMKQKTTLLIVILALISTTMFGQNEKENDAFKPSGKPFAKIFTNFHTDFTDGTSFSQFQLTRAYLGYQYEFSKHFSAKANLDFGNPGTGKLEMVAFVKNAYVSYHNKGLKVQFGLIGTTQFKLQESIWGNRYMYKSFQDEYGFGSSADLGVSVAYKFNKFIAADVSVLNGEGHKKLENDSVFKYSAGITITPIKNLYFRAYYDYMKKDFAEQSYSFFAGYQNNSLSVGAEYNKQLNHNLGDGKDYEGYSFYASYNMKKYRIYGRYDHITSATLTGETDPWNISKDGQVLIAGVQYTPIKGIKISPNYQLSIPAESGTPSTSGVYLSLEIKY